MAQETLPRNDPSALTAAPHTEANIEPPAAEAATALMETGQQDQVTADPTATPAPAPAIPTDDSTLESGGEITAAEQLAGAGRNRRLSAAAQAQAARAMAATASWVPNLERQQTWSKEDQKHELQMNRVEDVRPGCPGFSART